VLKRDQKSAVLSSDHHRIHLLIRRSTSPFTANVKEDGSLGILASIELVVDPVSLLVGATVLFIEMINAILKPLSIIVLHRDT